MQLTPYQKIVLKLNTSNKMFLNAKQTAEILSGEVKCLSSTIRNVRTSIQAFLPTDDLDDEMTTEQMVNRLFLTIIDLRKSHNPANSSRKDK